MSYAKVLTVSYPPKVVWQPPHEDEEEGFAGGKGEGEGGEEKAGRGCEAVLTMSATNRLAGHRDKANVNFTFEVRPDDGPRRVAHSDLGGALTSERRGAGGVGNRRGSSSGGSTGGQSLSRRSRHRFMWLGPTRRRVEGLGPGEVSTIPLKVRFFRPGVFDLNRFRFVVDFPSDPQGRVTFVFPAQYLVTVGPPDWSDRPSKKV
ncbi:unnamed protein product, partial [Discosporangium mesarthrocarpum]